MKREQLMKTDFFKLVAPGDFIPVSEPPSLVSGGVELVGHVA